MTQQEAFLKIKNLITERLHFLIADEAFKNAQLNKADYIESIYPVIMALGINFGDVEKAATDIFEMKADALGLDPSHMEAIQQTVVDVLGQFKTEVDVLTVFHFNTRQGMSYEDALNVAVRTFDDDFTNDLEEEEEQTAE